MCLCAQVTVSVPDDMDVDLDITLSQGDTLVVATSPDSTSVFNADFAGAPCQASARGHLGATQPVAQGMGHAWTPLS